MPRFTHLAFFFLLSCQLFSQSACSNVISQVIESDRFRGSDRETIRAQVCDATPFAEGTNLIVYLEIDSSKIATTAFVFEKGECSLVEMSVKYSSVDELISNLYRLEEHLSLHYDAISRMDPRDGFDPQKIRHSSFWVDKTRQLILTATSEPKPEVILQVRHQSRLTRCLDR